MTRLSELSTRPATPDTWDDVAAVMGDRGDASRCWCQYFLVRGRDFVPGEVSRERLRAQVRHGTPPGVLAYDGEQPVGWCQVGPKAALACGFTEVRRPVPGRVVVRLDLCRPGERA